VGIEEVSGHDTELGTSVDPGDQWDIVEDDVHVSGYVADRWYRIVGTDGRNRN